MKRRRAGHKEDIIELYQPRDGHLSHAFPAAGPGRIFAMSPDRRYALTVAAERGDTFDLDCWSLEGAKPLGRLGSYLARRKAKIFARPEEEIVPATTARFSPSGHRLLKCDGKSELRSGNCLNSNDWGPSPCPFLGCAWNSIRRTPALAMGAGAGFAETHYSFMGEDYRPPCPAFVRVIDLAAGKATCDFQNMEPREILDLCGLRFSGNSAVMEISRIQAIDSFPIFAWDLATGKRAAFEPVAAVSDPRWSRRTVELQSNFDNTRLLLIAFADASDNIDHQAIVQLWDLPRRKLLRGQLRRHQHQRRAGGGRRPAVRPVFIRRAPCLPQAAIRTVLEMGRRRRCAAVESGPLANRRGEPLGLVSKSGRDGAVRRSQRALTCRWKRRERVLAVPRLLEPGRRGLRPGGAGVVP